VPKEKGAPSFDSRKLGKGDIVAFRLWQPGPYTMTNEPGGHKAAVTVMNAENRQYPDLTKLEPVKVTLSDKGFNPARIEQWPFQALLISIDTAAALTLQSTKPAPAKPPEGKRPPAKAKKSARA
jgi:hypothetical protein